MRTPERKCCPVCGEAGKRIGGFPLCGPCLESIPWLTHTVCAKCGRPEACPDCARRTNAAFVAHRSAVRYSPLMKEWLIRYKYAGDERMESVLAWMMLSGYERLLIEVCGSTTRNVFDGITYVPLSPERIKERGFNQAARLAQALGRELGVPVAPLLRKKKETARQSQKGRLERIHEIRGAFTVEPAVAQHYLRSLSAIKKRQSGRAPLRPLRLLLIDDVYTTGSTINECARMLRQALPCYVYALTWARS
jgi:competence protein ComFC